MRKFAYLLLTVTLVGCQTEKESDFLLLNLASIGEVKLIPDMASMSATVSCTDKIIERSAECSKRAIKDLFQLLDKNGVKKEDYHSSRIELEKEYTWRNSSNVFEGYKSSSTISIVFRDLDAMTQIVTGALTMKSVELYGLNYSHSQIDEFSQQAYLNALDNANVLAERMQAKVAGKSVQIIEISNNNNGFVSNITEEKGEWLAQNYSGRTRSAPAPIPVNPGELTLTKEVNVLYKVYR